MYSLFGEGTDEFNFFAIVGIAAGAVIIGLFSGKALVDHRRRRGSQLPDDDLDLESGESGEFAPAGSYINVEVVGSEKGAVHAVKGDSMVVGTYEDQISVGGSSSNAGSSGWSSSAGVSSMNTGSVDSNEYFGSSLAAIGAASNVHKRYGGTKNETMYPIKGDDESSHSDRYVMKVY